MGNDNRTILLKQLFELQSYFVFLCHYIFFDYRVAIYVLYLIENPQIKSMTT